MLLEENYTANPGPYRWPGVRRGLQL